MKNCEINIRDPFVLVHDNRYYLYGTRGSTVWGKATGFDVYVGSDLENWDGPYPVFERTEDFWADRHFWAPEVHKWNGRFYMFASFKSETHCRGTAVLISDSPMGPFSPLSNGPVTPNDWECLDGTFYCSKEGKPYMVFCHEWLQVGNGEIYAVELSHDLSKAVSAPRLLFTAKDALWTKEVNHPNGITARVTDGPFLWRTQEGTLECLWASFSETGYTEGVAVSDNNDISGNFLQTEPLFRDDGGHAMVFNGIDGNIYMALHKPNKNPFERPVFIRMTEENGVLKKAL